jgi:hypothetical protein
MKKYAAVLFLCSLIAVSAEAKTKAKTKAVAHSTSHSAPAANAGATERQPATSTTGSSISSELASDSPSSSLGRTELALQLGTAISSPTVGIVAGKVSHKLPVPTRLYGELGLGLNFNSRGVIFPLDFGLRWDFRLFDEPRAQPFFEFALGPAFSTYGKSSMLHLVLGPGLMYRMAGYDLRFDMGLVLFGDSAGLQVLGGVAL